MLRAEYQCLGCSMYWNTPIGGPQACPRCDGRHIKWLNAAECLNRKNGYNFRSVLNTKTEV